METICRKSNTFQKKTRKTVSRLLSQKSGIRNVKFEVPALSPKLFGFSKLR